MSKGKVMRMLYLPVSQRSVLNVIEKGRQFVSGLSVIEMSAIITIANIPMMSKSETNSEKIEILLAKVIAELTRLRESLGEVELSSLVSNKLSQSDIVSGLRILGELQISFMSQEEVESRKYLNFDGSWNFKFLRHESSPREELDPHFRFGRLLKNYVFSNEHFRIPQILWCECFEDLDVYGFAGTGKTHLIDAIARSLVSKGIAKEQILVLSLTYQQLGALRGFLCGVDAMTFNSFVVMLLKGSYLPPKSARIRHISASGNTLCEEKVANAFGMKGFGRWSKTELASIAIKTFRKFCFSDDPKVGLQHIPSGIRDNMVGLEECVLEQLSNIVVRVAEGLWCSVVDGKNEAMPVPIKGYVQVKYAAMFNIRLLQCNRSENGEMHKRYRYVIIDEGHDLSPAMRQVLDQNSLVKITLRDDYQNSSGLLIGPQSRTRVRRLVTSWRAGEAMEELLNPLISLHPYPPNDLFVGSREIQTEIEYYREILIPDEDCAILVGDKWSLWAWTHRFAEKGEDFIYHGNIDELSRFVEAVIRLKNYNERPWHFELRDFPDWESLEKDKSGEPGFEEVKRILFPKYNLGDWREDSKRCRGQGESGYRLGRFSDVRNYEFDRVMIGQDASSRLSLLRSKRRSDRIRIINEIYVAMTRAKYKLIVPESLRDVLEDLLGSV